MIQYRPNLSIPLSTIDQKAEKFVDKFSKKSIEFDGVDEYITVADSVRFDDISGDFTLSIWFRLENDFDSSSATSMGLCGKYLDSSNHVSFALAGIDNSRANGTFYCKLENTTPLYLNTVQNAWIGGVWYNALATYDFASGLGSMYINDVLDGSASVASMAPFTVAAPWEIGRVILEQAGGAMKYFEGTLNNLSVHTEILSVAERSQQYNGGVPIDLSLADPAADLKLWWKLGASPDDVEVADGVVEAITGLDDGSGINMTNATDIINEAPAFP